MGLPFFLSLSYSLTHSISTNLLVCSWTKIQFMQFKQKTHNCAFRRSFFSSYYYIFLIFFNLYKKIQLKIEFNMWIVKAEALGVDSKHATYNKLEMYCKFAEDVLSYKRSNWFDLDTVPVSQTNRQWINTWYLINE